MAGLQGSGKTTNSAKLARWFKSQGRHPLLVGADLQRPAAVEQLRTLGRQIDVPGLLRGHRPGGRWPPPASPRPASTGRDVVIVDTAGRLAIDAELMDEVRRISEAVEPELHVPRRRRHDRPGRGQHRRGLPRDPRARRRHPHQARRRRPRRRRPLGEGGRGPAHRLRVHRREARGLRPVPPRPPRRSDPGHGRHAHPHREGRGGLREGRGRGRRGPPDGGAVHLRRLPRPDAAAQEDGPAVGGPRDDAGRAQGGAQRRDRRQARSAGSRPSSAR